MTSMPTAAPSAAAPTPTPEPSTAPTIAGALPEIKVEFNGEIADLHTPTLREEFCHATVSRVIEVLDNMSTTFCSGGCSNKIDCIPKGGSIIAVITFVDITSVTMEIAEAIAAEIDEEAVAVLVGGSTYTSVAATAAANTRAPISAPTASPEALSGFKPPSRAPMSSRPSAMPTSQPTREFDPYVETSAPSSAKPTPVPTAPPMPPPPVNRDYCPSGYRDYGIRYDMGLGRVIIVRTHQECSDRCDTYSGVQYAGGCRAYMTGMYMQMLFCRSYGGGPRTQPCASWAHPSDPGRFSGVIGHVGRATGQTNIGGSCCTNTTFVDITG